MSDVRVLIIESERGWGPRVDEVKKFQTRNEALEFCRSFNEPNKSDVVPDWYMKAVIDE